MKCLSSLCTSQEFSLYTFARKCRPAQRTRPTIQRNCSPWTGLVIVSASILVVGVYTILISLPLILSLIRCCLTLRCLVLCLPPPLVTKLIVDMLSCRMRGIFISVIPCSLMNSSHCSTIDIRSDSATSSASVESFVTIFRFFTCIADEYCRSRVTLTVTVRPKCCVNMRYYS